MEYCSILWITFDFLFLSIFIVFRVCLSFPWLGLFQSIFWCNFRQSVFSFFPFFFFFTFSFWCFIYVKKCNIFWYINIYPVTLLNWSVLVLFCVESLGFSILNILSYAYNDIFISSLLICIPFVFLVCLLCRRLPMIC